MLTKDDHLTAQGDCIIGVGADKACTDLTSTVRDVLRRKEAEVEVTISIGEYSLRVLARGSPLLLLNDSLEMVVRRSNYSSNRTLALCADKAACDLPLEMVNLLKNPDSEGTFTVKVVNHRSNVTT